MAGVIKQFGASYLSRFGWQTPGSQRRAMAAIELCRTAALGGQVLECGTCGVQNYAYHSCRHRSCPRCMREDSDEWVKARLPELLPVPYFHVVFGVPKRLHGIIRAHKRALYPVLMSAAAKALEQVAANPKYLGGTVGVLATLHTAAHTLFYHPHVHCLMPAGSVDEHGRWHAAKRPNFAPKELLAKAFRARLLEMMVDAAKHLQLSDTKLRLGWKVYVDQPKHGVVKVLEYLARPLYRGPLDNHRIVEINDVTVRFEYPGRDWRKPRSMTLGGHEFLRRFLHHVWPNRLHKVRYFGLWSRKCRPQLEALRQQLLAAGPKPAEAEEGVAACAGAAQQPAPHWLKCPHCSGQRVVLGQFRAGGSPPPLRTPIPTPHIAVPPPTAQPP